MLFRVILIYILAIAVRSLKEFNNTEVVMCHDMNPSTIEDCTKMQFKTIFCCHLNMSLPAVGKICVPMSLSSMGIVREINTTIPIGINVIGDMNCFGEKRNISKYLLTIVLFLFLI